MQLKFANSEDYSFPLQVAVGNKEPASANPLVFNADIAANGSAGPFSFDVFLFYRVASNPASPGAWSSWVQEFTDAQQTVDVP